MPRFRAPVLASVITVLLYGLMLAGGALAASPEPGDPTYPSLRYDDDFAHLEAAANSSDPWDRFKYILHGDGQHGPS